MQEQIHLVNWDLSSTVRKICVAFIARITSFPVFRPAFSCHELHARAFSEGTLEFKIFSLKIATKHWTADFLRHREDMLFQQCLGSSSPCHHTFIRMGIRKACDSPQSIREWSNINFVSLMLESCARHSEPRHLEVGRPVSFLPGDYLQFYPIYP